MLRSRVRYTFELVVLLLPSMFGSAVGAKGDDADKAVFCRDYQLDQEGVFISLKMPFFTGSSTAVPSTCSVFEI